MESCLRIQRVREAFTVNKVSKIPTSNPYRPHDAPCEDGLTVQPTCTLSLAGLKTRDDTESVALYLNSKQACTYNCIQEDDTPVPAGIHSPKA